MKISTLVILWFVSAIFCLSLGQYRIDLKNIFMVLFGYGNEIQTNILYSIRIPRILLSSFCGGLLALSGLCLQGVFKNPLVGPNIIGVSTAASFGGAMAILLGLSGYKIAFFAFVFGILSLVLLYAISRYITSNNVFSLILSGVIINGFFSALISLVQYLSDNEEILPNIVFWLLGSFTNANNAKLILTVFLSIIPLVLLFCLSYRINLLSLDDSDLKALQINSTALRLGILSLCTLLIALQVSISGNIGWIGLVVPHISRLLSGSNHINSMPTSFLVGAIFMLLIDTLARTLSSSEIPLGIISALFGTPIFILLLKKSIKNAS